VAVQIFQTLVAELTVPALVAVATGRVAAGVRRIGRQRAQPEAAVAATARSITSGQERRPTHKRRAAEPALAAEVAGRARVVAEAEHEPAAAAAAEHGGAVEVVAAAVAAAEADGAPIFD
jgi:hypothetical protein